MAGGVPDKHFASGGTPDPRQEFIDFCEAEFERRRNSGDRFDESAYRGAMELVLDRLVVPDDERAAR
jgi:hypothetical protein